MHYQQLDLGIGPPTVDPNCLCGHAHPCPAHGPHIGPYEPYTPAAAHDPTDSFTELSVLRTEVAPNLDTDLEHRHHRGAA